MYRLDVSPVSAEGSPKNISLFSRHVQICPFFPARKGEKFLAGDRLDYQEIDIAIPSKFRCSRRPNIRLRD